MVESFGKYRLLSRLGGGGMAEVWRAEVSYTPQVSKVVALKMIRKDLHGVKQLVSLFIDEARITSRISHANVAQVFDFGDVEGRPYLAMELVEGSDLETLWNRSMEQKVALPVEVAAFIVAEVARGLASAHSLGDDEGEPLRIVHRDVSPQNVLISWAGEVKLTDFGIARARDKITQTDAGSVMGKFRYMSPEQVGGIPLDARSDVFSCGILLFELVTGRHLFDGASSAVVVDQIRYMDLPKLSDLRPEADEALDNVALWALQRDREHRCPEALNLARDLERYVHINHPHFTREALVDVMHRLLPDRRRGRADKKLAYAGTELAADLRDAEKPDAPRAKKAAPGVTARAKGIAPASEIASLPDQQPRSDSAITGREDTVLSDPGLAATVGSGPGGTSPPAEATPASPTDFDDADGSEVSALLSVDEQADAPPLPEATLTLARRASISGSTPRARAVSQEEPTEILESPGDGEQTAPTVSAPAEANGASPTPVPADTLEPTRTAAADIDRISPAAERRRRRQTEPHPRRRKRSRLESGLGIMLAALLLGAVVLLLLRSQQSDDKKSGPSGDPMAASSMDDAATAAPRRDGGADDATGPRGDAGTHAKRLAVLDQEIALLRATPGLTTPSASATWRQLLDRVAQRVTAATQADDGRRTLGPPPRVSSRLSKNALRLADLLAEHLLLGDRLPDTLREALGTVPPPKAKGRKPAPPDRLAALRVLEHPRKAALQERLIRSQGALKRWRRQADAQRGSVFRYPYLVVPAAAVARLGELSKNSRLARHLSAYLKARPRKRAVVVQRKLSCRFVAARWNRDRKGDDVFLEVTLSFANRHPARSEPLPLPGNALHGLGEKPLTTSTFTPSDPSTLAPGQRRKVTLIYVLARRPAGFAAHLVLKRPGGGVLRLQVLSDLLP